MDMSSVLITGATGSCAVSINGVYIPTQVIHNNHTLFRKNDGTGKWLAFATSNKWMVHLKVIILALKYILHSYKISKVKSKFFSLLSFSFI